MNYDDDDDDDEGRPFHVARVIHGVRGFKSDIFKKTFFSILTAEMKAATIN